MSVVGFDFGTVNCKVAVARKGGIDVLQNETGHRITPSAIGFQGKQRFLGGEALAQYVNNAKNTVTNVKRLLGHHLDDADVKSEQTFLSCKLAKVRQNDVGVQVMYEDNSSVFSAEQVTSALLYKLKSIAEKGLQSKVVDCVIGVPAIWTEGQRRALLDSAKISGLNVLRLLNESTAVALSYGLSGRQLPKDTPQKVLFLDMGYAHTQVSVAAIQDGKLNILAHNVDRHLGGREFDEMLTQHLVQYIKTKYKMDPTTEFKPMIKLRRESERIKVTLSANVKVPFNLEYFMNDKDVNGTIDRPEFDALATKTLLPRLTDLIKATLDKAKVKKEELFSIEVVGGSVRIPIVQKYLTDYFGRELSKTCDGDESVARGCALMCAMISPTFRVKEFQVEDSTPYAIDLLWGPVPAKGQEDAWKCEDSTPLFPLFNTIPSVKLISFNDRSDPFQIVARYAEPGQLPPGTTPVIGRFIIHGLSKSEERKGKIKVKVKLSQNSTLSVTSAQLIEEVKEEPAAPAPAAAATAAAPAAGATPAASPSPAATGDEMDEEKPADGKPAPAAAAANAAGDKMETEPTAKKDEVKKVKVKKTDLKYDSFFTAGLEEPTINQYFERETIMQNQDRLIHETHEARNNLEAYILDMRARLDGDLAQYVKNAEKDAFLGQLMTAEEWLNNDGLEAQKSEYKKKLDELHVHGNPIKQREYEEHNRETAIRTLKSVTAASQQFAASKEEKYAHITEDERKKVLAEVEKVEQWLFHAQGQQDKLSKADNPALTCAALHQKKVDLEKAIQPIMFKPKPAAPKPEPKKEEPKKEEAKPADAEKKDNGAAGAAASGAAASGSTADANSGAAGSEHMDTSK